MQEFQIPNTTPGRRNCLGRLIQAAESQFTVQNVVAVGVSLAPAIRPAHLSWQAAGDTGSAAYADFMAKMKKEPKKVRSTAQLAPVFSSWLSRFMWMFVPSWARSR